MSHFTIGQAVDRREDRTPTRATIVAITFIDDEPVYQIAYEEGGQGWWPHSALEAA